MHDTTAHNLPPGTSPCASATRIRALLDLSGLSGMVFLSKAIPEHLYPLVRQLLDAPTEEEFHRIRHEATGEYASLSTPDKRELMRRLSTILPANALAELGRLLDDPPKQQADPNRLRLALEANTLRLLTALPPFIAPLLFGLGPELAEQFIAVFEAQDDEASELAWNAFNVALEADPERASAALEHGDVRFMLAALRRIVKAGRPKDPPVPSRTATLKARLALVRECLRGSVRGGALGLVAPPLFATAGALAPVLAHAFEKLPSEYRDALSARLADLQDQLPFQGAPLGWFR